MRYFGFASGTVFNLNRSMYTTSDKKSYTHLHTQKEQALQMHSYESI